MGRSAGVPANRLANRGRLHRLAARRFSAIGAEFLPGEVYGSAIKALVNTFRDFRTVLLTISPSETSFSVRQFARCSDEVRNRLEAHGNAFVAGFNLALIAGDADDFAARALAVAPAERGFAYEGAAMASALLDLLSLGRVRRLRDLLAGPGRPHAYMVHVGAGWALARLRLRPSGRLPALDPLLRWLTVDGYGFHEGFFHPERAVRRPEPTRRLSGYALRAFDQGLGRSLWFIDAADVERIATTVSTFPRERRADLWSGVALAAAYAGAVDEAGLERLRQLAVGYERELAQGAAFAATARIRAGNEVPETDMGCRVLAGVSPEKAAAVVADELARIGVDVAGSGYERWRTAIGIRLAGAAQR
jgi:hypothetical protein